MEPENVFPDELRLLCPCGTIFTTGYIEPECPSCGKTLVIRFKRGKSSDGAQRQHRNRAPETGSMELVAR